MRLRRPLAAVRIPRSDKRPISKRKCNSPFPPWAAPTLANAASELKEHRSHFGSRYKLGCCVYAGLLPQFESRARTNDRSRRENAIPPFPRGRRPRWPTPRRSSRSTVAILAQGTSWAVAFTQASCRSSNPALGLTTDLEEKMRFPCFRGIPRSPR